MLVALLELIDVPVHCVLLAASAAGLLAARALHWALRRWVEHRSGARQHRKALQRRVQAADSYPEWAEAAMEVRLALMEAPACAPACTPAACSFSLSEARGVDGRVRVAEIGALEDELGARYGAVRVERVHELVVGRDVGREDELDDAIFERGGARWRV